MTEKLSYGKVVVCDYQCSKCDDGRQEIERVHEVFGSPSYIHRCNKCGIVDMTLKRTYPYVYYERDDGTAFAL